MHAPQRLERLLRIGVLVVLLVAGAATAHSTSLEVGSPFPDLALRTLDGDVQRVSDYRGEKLILHVFASW